MLVVQIPWKCKESQIAHILFRSRGIIGANISKRPYLNNNFKIKLCTYEAIGI